LRLTSPFNLPAPGRRQTLYVVFDFAEPCVFSKQSPGPLYCNSFTLTEQVRSRYGSTPSSEVTGPICRVPKRVFSLAPEDFLLAYLCRFAVRVPEHLLRGFSWQRGVSDFVTRRSRSGPSVQRLTGFAWPISLQPSNWSPCGPNQSHLASCVPPS
jgi:hypothetical protein